MATVGAIAEALADTFDEITGLRPYSYVPESINPPAVILSLGEIERQSMGRGTMSVPFDATILVSRSSDRVGQGSLYEYASFTGTKSVWNSIDANHALGLSDGTRATVLRYRPLAIEEIAAYGYFGGSFALMITTPGT